MSPRHAVDNEGVEPLDLDDETAYPQHEAPDVDPIVEESTVSQPLEEQTDIAQNTGGESPAVEDNGAKRAGELRVQDDAARLADPSKPVIRGGEPGVGGEHFHNYDGK